MRANRLNHRVTYQVPTTTNVDGESTTTWSDVGTYWAFVRPVGMAEKPADPQVTATRTHEVSTYYRPGVVFTTQGRFVFNGRTLNIVSIINVDEANDELRIGCLEVA